MIPQTKRLRKVHERARTEFECAESAVRDEREQCLEDRRFYSIAGAQWDGPFAEAFTNKPKLEVNKVHLSVIRVINEWRNNRLDVTFTTKDGSDAGQLADSCAELYRADEQDSGAEEAYDNGYEEAVGGGIGAWRYRACYEDEGDDENEHQRIRMEPIHDADTCVFFDANCKRQDKADARRCWVLTSYTHEAYEEKYGGNPSTWPKSIWQANGSAFEWVGAEIVWVAEYYEVEEQPDVIEVWVERATGTEQRLRASDLDPIEPGEIGSRRAMRRTGWKLERTKRITRKRVHKYVLDGNGVLEDCGYIAGSNIPVVVVYGKRWVVDNVERCMGHVRLAKDAQRLKNMQLSKLAEISGKSTVEKPILTPEQVNGHETYWARDNIEDYPYLLVNPIVDANGQEVATGPIGYTKPPTIPQALAALLEITETDLRDLLGNQEAGEEMQPGASGKLIELVQAKLDMQAFVYVDNMRKAVKRGGEIWLGMARELYVEEGRKMKGLNREGKPSSVELVKPSITKGGKTTYDNDLTKATFDVRVDVGPTTQSRKQSVVRAMTAVMQVTDDPETRSVLTSMIMMNLEGEGLQDVRDYFRGKMIRLGVAKPTPEEQEEIAQEQANVKPDANDEYLKAAADQARADAVKKATEAELNVTKRQQIEQEIDVSKGEQALDALERLAPGSSGTSPREQPTTNSGTSPRVNG
jgi:hypothetical protein